MVIKGKEVKQIVSRLSIVDHNKIKALKLDLENEGVKDSDGNYYILHTLSRDLILLGYDVMKKQLKRQKELDAKFND